nr:(Fe-S)-binding protein [Bacteroidota bacterium]
LYDFGMLNQAKKMLLDIMETLKDEIRNGIPIVGLEPSCVAVFRDELHNLFPHKEDAARLKKQVFTLAEFLEQKAPDFEIPQLENKAIMHGHCHHKAIMKIEPEKKLLKKTGLDFKILDSGCCGMAGYFGYEKGDRYDVSIKAGERVLLPAVRNLEMSGIIIADGFSCREQIEQSTNRKGMHLAQVLDMALQGEQTYDANPEKDYLQKHKITATKKQKLIRNSVVAVSVVLAALLITKTIFSKNKME